MTPKERILELIKNSGKSDNEIIKNSGLKSISTISDWKRKENANPSLDALIKIAKYFNVSTDYLLGLVDYPEPIGQIYGRLDKDEKNKVWRLLIDLFPDKSGKVSS